MEKNRIFWAITIVVTVSLVYAYINIFFDAKQKYIAMVEYEYWIQDLKSEVNGIEVNHQYILQEFNQSVRKNLYKNNTKIAIGIPYVTKINNDYMYLKGDSTTDMLSFIEKVAKETLIEVIMQGDIGDIFNNIDKSYDVYCKSCARIESETKIRKDKKCHKFTQDEHLLTEKTVKLLQSRYCHIETAWGKIKTVENELIIKELLNLKNSYLLTLEQSKISIIGNAVDSFKSKTHTSVKRIYQSAF